MKHYSIKKSIAILLTFLMMLAAVTPFAAAEDQTSDFTVSDWASLQAAFNEGGSVTLGGDVIAPAGAAVLTVPSRTRSSLYLNGHTIDRALTEETEKGSVIIVSGELDVCGPGTITGGCTSGSGGGLWVKRDGSVVLDEDVIVSGNHAKYTGGGVYVSGKNANFYMMDGTSITNNSAKNGGGLAQDSTGCLYIFSGSICNNTASNNGGGIWYGGGSGAALNLTGGVISGNTAGNDGGGVYANRSAFVMGADSTITGNTAGHSGGGVFMGGDVFEPGGTISGNTALTDPEIGAKDGSSIPSYTVTIDGSIANGTVTADKASAKYGEVVNLTVTPASENYVPDYLTVTDASGNPVALSDNSFVMPKSNVSVSAVFREIMDFRVETKEYDSSTDHGRVYLSDHCTEDFVYEGSTVTAFADPDSGMIAVSWTVLMKDELSGEYIYTVPNVSRPTPNTISFTMPSADVLISATFTERHDQRLVFVTDTEGGTVLTDKTLVGDQDDPKVTLTIQPGNGYRYVPDSLCLMDVDRDGMSQLDITGFMDTVTENSVYSINIGSNDLYVSASFEKVPAQPKHCVVVDSETENGTISADYDLAEEGWTVKVTANPDAYRGYAVRSVTVTDEGGTTYPVTDLGYNEYTFIMPSTDVFVTAEFGIPVYPITANSPTAEPTGCELDVVNEAEVGDDVTVWISVPDERSLESLTVAGDNTNTNYDIRLDYHKEGAALYRYKFTMPGEPVTVTAVFGTTKYPLTVNEAVEGTVTFTVNGEAVTEAAYGETVNVSYVYENKTGTYEDIVDSVTYAYTISDHVIRRQLNDLTITDGTCTGSFSMPSAPVEIGAIYSSPYTVSWTDVQDGSIDVSVSGTPHFATFRAYPDETVMMSAISSLSEKVRADWHVTYTDETGEHSVEITRISDREASFLMPAASVTISAELTPLGVPYKARSWNSANETLTEQTRYYTGEYTNLSSVTNDTLSDGWYLLDSSKTFENRITVTGNVRLILTDNMTLTAREGISVSKDATLSIYGQSDDSGTLKATGSDGSAGIGGDEDGAHGSINIYGGTIDATGGSHSAGIGTGEDAEGACGAICIFGGDITAIGGEYGAGIGGGDESTGAQIEIYGGDIDARGGDEGAGIGGGCERGPSRVTIRGGKIKAKGGKYGAGIGEGYDASSSTSSGTVIIRGCESIYTTGGYLAAGIGGGFYNNTKIKIYIYGGEDIYAYGSSENDCGAAGIGAGSFSNISGIQSGGGDFDGVISISGGTVHAVGSGTYASFSETNAGAAGLGAGYGGNMTGSITVSGGAVRAVGTNGGAAIGAGAETWGPSYGGECEGSVTITGGALELHMVNNSGDNKALLIGHGCNGDTNGELTLGPNMCVTKSDMRPVAAGDRVSACRSSSMLALIEECKHENATYQLNNEQTHIRNCVNCLFSEEEEHFFFDGSCDCGAEGCGVFFFDGGELLDARMSYGMGGTVEPPEDPEKEGLIFGGWYSYQSLQNDEPYDFDEPIYEDVYLTARWMAKIEVSIYDRTTQTFGVGGKVSVDGSEDLVTHEEILTDTGLMIDLNAMKDDGYDFVGWVHYENIDSIYIPTAGFSTRITENEHFCAVFEEHVHSLRFVSGYEPECEYYGEIDHYKCTKCGKLFSDEDGMNEVTEEDITIPAIHHDWDEPNYEWSEDYSELTARCVCKNDEDHVLEETVGVSSEVTKEPTCEGKGETTYTSAAFENEAFEAQSVTVEDVDPSGHDFGAWTKLDENRHQRVCSRDAGHVETGDHAWDEGRVTKEASCVSEGEMTYTCTVCQATKTESIGLMRHVSAPAVKENEVAPTCTSEGSYDSVVYCVNCPTELYRETITVKKLDHTPAAAVIENEVPATCMKNGSYDSVVYCKNCPAEISRSTVTTNKLPHTPVTLPGTPATCVDSGLTDGQICASCGIFIVPQQTIPATGKHVDNNGDGKCDTCGTAVEIPGNPNICKWCGKEHGSGFIDKLIAFFHQIFAAIFGAKY